MWRLLRGGQLTVMAGMESMEWYQPNNMETTWRPHGDHMETTYRPLRDHSETAGKNKGVEIG